MVLCPDGNTPLCSTMLEGVYRSKSIVRRHSSSATISHSSSLHRPLTFSDSELVRDYFVSNLARSLQQHPNVVASFAATKRWLNCCWRTILLDRLSIFRVLPFDLSTVCVISCFSSPQRSDLVLPVPVPTPQKSLASRVHRMYGFSSALVVHTLNRNPMP